MDSNFSTSDEVIQREKFIIMRKTFESTSCKLVKLGNEKYFYFGKQKINVESLLGHKYGSTFELNNERNLVLVDLGNYFLNMNKDEDQNVTKDNRFIKDDNRSQKLTRNDIEKIKINNAGRDVIKSLVENSTTFEEKNKFSQEKYLTKKKQKYLNMFTILKPSVKFLMEMYFAQGPTKNNYLRIDSLSQMLTLANVMSGGNYIVVDSNLGILSAALIEKTGGCGSIIQIYTEDNLIGSYRQAVNALNYPELVVENCLYSLNINEAAQILFQDISPVGDKIETPLNSNDEKILSRKEKRLIEENKAKEKLSKKNFHGLLMLTKNYDPYSLCNILLDFLENSRPFVIFSSALDPLKECYVKLKSRCIYLRISETWLRKYQVLNDRTRPEMTMNACSGFVLSGIKVEM